MDEADGVALVASLEIPGYGPDEVTFVDGILSRWKPAFIGEWGTNRGASCRIFQELTKAQGLSCQIVTVELPVTLAPLSSEHAGVDVGALIRSGGAVTQLLGDGVTEALDAWVRRYRPRALFFVDGDHSRPNVLRELAALAVMAPDQVVLLHDTNGPVGDAVREFTAPAALCPWRHEALASDAGMMSLWPR